MSSFSKVCKGSSAGKPHVVDSLHRIKIFCVYWVLLNSKLTTHVTMESVSLIKVIELLLDAEHVFSILSLLFRVFLMT